MFVFKMCRYDEGYDMQDAYEIGWCYKCINDDCPMKIELEKKNKKKKTK